MEIGSARTRSRRASIEDPLRKLSHAFRAGKPPTPRSARLPGRLLARLAPGGLEDGLEGQFRESSSRGYPERDAAARRNAGLHVRTPAARADLHAARIESNPPPSRRDSRGGKYRDASGRVSGPDARVRGGAWSDTKRTESENARSFHGQVPVDPYRRREPGHRLEGRSLGTGEPPELPFSDL